MRQGTTPGTLHEQSETERVRRTVEHDIEQMHYVPMPDYLQDRDLVVELVDIYSCNLGCELHAITRMHQPQSCRCCAPLNG